MGLHHQYDGEFWMDFFKDFCREFEEVTHFNEQKPLIDIQRQL